MAKKKHTRIVASLTVLVILMLGFGFALIPIYNTLCKALNINGKTNTIAEAYDRSTVQIDKERLIEVQFVATNNSQVPWIFRPSTQKIKIHPGEITRLSFYAENQTNHRMTVQAIPSVTPGLAAKYLKKTECFCFTQQSLNGHEAMDMPLLFHLDPELPKNIHTLTLSYTLFDVTGK